MCAIAAVAHVRDKMLGLQLEYNCTSLSRLRWCQGLGEASGARVRAQACVREVRERAEARHEIAALPRWMWHAGGHGAIERDEDERKQRLLQHQNTGVGLEVIKGACSEATMRGCGACARQSLAGHGCRLKG